VNASNWAVCPKCLRKRREAVAKAEKKSSDSYGKVSKEAYQSLHKKAADLASEGQEPTLQEDYELGIYEDGSFYVRYTANCEQCSFGHRFVHDEQVIPKETP
jgi:hypothetical protein